MGPYAYTRGYSIKIKIYIFSFPQNGIQILAQCNMGGIGGGAEDKLNGLLLRTKLGNYSGERPIADCHQILYIP